MRTPRCLGSKLIYILIFASFVSAPSGTWAQETIAPSSQSVSTMSWRAKLDAAMERLDLSALDNAQSNATRASQEAAARRFAGPLEADSGLRQDAIGSGRGYYEAEVGVMAPLWRRGERSLLLEQAASGGAIARAARDAMRLEVAGDLRTAWWTYAVARATAIVDAEQVVLANDVVTQVTRLVEGGEMARLDLRQAQIAAANAAEAATISQGEASSARLTLEGLIGPFTGDLPQEGAAITTSMHPKLALLETEAGEARTRARLASASANPRWRVGVDVRAERGMRGEDLGVSTGIRAAIPLGPDYKARADAAAIGAQAARADLIARRAQIDITVQIAKAANHVTTMRARLTQAEAAAVASQDALALTIKGRREGELSFIEELRARTLAGDASRALALAQIAVAAAISAQNQAQGQLP
jgi:outer membrane protein, heavy metal efflux system